MSRVITMNPFTKWADAQRASRTGQVLAVDGGYLGCVGVRYGKVFGVDASGEKWAVCQS